MCSLRDFVRLLNGEFHFISKEALEEAFLPQKDVNAAILTSHCCVASDDTLT